jgi:signal transduction histidine kinase
VQLRKLTYLNLDSLESILSTKGNDTARANFLGLLSFQFAFNEAEKAVAYGQQGIQLSKELSYKKGIAYCSQSLAMALWGLGNYSNGLQAGLNALHLYDEMNDEQNIAFTYYILANVYRDFGDYKRALTDARKGLNIYESLGTTEIIGNAIIGSIYDLANQIDSASFYIKKAFQMDRQINQGKWGWLYYLQGNIHRKMKQYDSAMYYYKAALPLVQYKDIVETFNGIATLYQETGREDSSIFYATEVLQKWSFVSYQRGLLHAANILADVYKKLNQPDSAIKYLELSVTLNNKLYNQKNERDIQNLAFNEQLRQDEILRQREQYRDQLKMYGLLAIGITLLIIAFLLWRNNQQRKKAYSLLRKQKEETDHQKTKAEQTLEELKFTQAQLIQSEKMASLGELTAGIAHEIQNPLNFVNNFSEVNNELIEELKGQKSTLKSEEQDDMLNDIFENNLKISHHGKRADAIVKGMLQHSQKSSSKKETTDINALAEEYLRLSYHGFRAKDNSFNTNFTTHFDETIGKIEVAPQDIGRVLLNLYNNAFYAVNEKNKQLNGTFEPTVSVSTKQVGDNVEISVRDNGVGMPQKVVDKIFQPFFTTKPTGQGTGLGLSLSYDIIKAHGGAIKVETKEGEFAEFIIRLPPR